MIDLRELNETIDDLKRHGATIGAAEKLALLYIAREHMEREEQEKQKQTNDVEHGYSSADDPRLNVVDVEPKSEFLSACNGAPVDGVLMIMNEHMEAIRVLYPKEYTAIVEKLRSL